MAYTVYHQRNQIPSLEESANQVSRRVSRPVSKRFIPEYANPPVDVVTSGHLPWAARTKMHHHTTAGDALQRQGRAPENNASASHRRSSFSSQKQTAADTEVMHVQAFACSVGMVKSNRFKTLACSDRIQRGAPSNCKESLFVDTPDRLTTSYERLNAAVPQHGSRQLPCPPL